MLYRNIQYGNAPVFASQYLFCWEDDIFVELGLGTNNCYCAGFKWKLQLPRCSSSDSANASLRHDLQSNHNTRRLLLQPRTIYVHDESSLLLTNLPLNRRLELGTGNKSKALRSFERERERASFLWQVKNFHFQNYTTDDTWWHARWMLIHEWQRRVSKECGGARLL